MSVIYCASKLDLNGKTNGKAAEFLAERDSHNENEFNIIWKIAKYYH